MHALVKPAAQWSLQATLEYNSARWASNTVQLAGYTVAGLKARWQPMNGLSLVSRVRCDHPAIRSIVMSGHSNAPDATNAGATGFLSKPFLNQTMVDAVLDTIKRHLPREKPLAPLH